MDLPINLGGGDKLWNHNDPIVQFGKINFQDRSVQGNLSKKGIWGNYNIWQAYQIYKCDSTIESFISDQLDKHDFNNDNRISFQNLAGLDITYVRSTSEFDLGAARTIAYFKNFDGLFETISFHPSELAVKDYMFWDSIEFSILNSINLGESRMRTDTSHQFKLLNGDQVTIKTGSKYSFKNYLDSSGHFLTLDYLYSDSVRSLIAIICSSEEFYELNNAFNIDTLNFQEADFIDIDFLHQKKEISNISNRGYYYAKLVYSKAKGNSLYVYALYEDPTDFFELKRLLESFEIKPYLNHSPK